MTVSNASAVERHYANDHIVEPILAAVRAQIGDDTPITAEALAPIDHFHSRGLDATRELMTALGPTRDQSLLDIGCGIGGPARWIASQYGCRVTGIDLTEAFCKAARILNELTGLADRVTIIHGDALALPFADATFDMAYSQNVIMNIADKARFYREALRVLRSGGRCAFANLVRGDGGEPYYPVPWAETAATSFLASEEETRADILAAGFEMVSFRASSEDPDVARQARLKLESGWRPALSPHVFVGERMFTYQLNNMRNNEEGRVRRVEIVARKS